MAGIFKLLSISIDEFELKNLLAIFVLSFSILVFHVIFEFITPIVNTGSNNAQKIFPTIAQSFISLQKGFLKWGVPIGVTIIQIFMIWKA